MAVAGSPGIIAMIRKTMIGQPEDDGDRSQQALGDVGRHSSAPLPGVRAMPGSCPGIAIRSLRLGDVCSIRKKDGWSLKFCHRGLGHGVLLPVGDEDPGRVFLHHGLHLLVELGAFVLVGRTARGLSRSSSTFGLE